MNNVTIMGRITNDLGMRKTWNGKPMLSFTVAVYRQKEDVDFIRCTAWAKTAEFIEKYFSKGSMIAVRGSLRAGIHTDKNGNPVYRMQVNAEKAFFTGEKSHKPQNNFDTHTGRNNGSYSR